MQHRPAPDDRRIVVREESHRDDLQAVLLGRHDLLAVGDELRLHAEHDRHVGAVDVAVDDADATAALGQRNGQIHRHGRLADAALAGADRDDVLHARQRLTCAVADDAFADARAHLHVDAGDTGHLQHGGARLIAHLILDRTRRRRQLDGEGDLPAVNLEILDEAERDDVLVKIRILDDLQRIEHGDWFNGHGLKNIGFSARITRSPPELL